MNRFTGALLAAAACLAAAPAGAATFQEGFTPFAGWQSRWFASNSNAANYYATEFGDPVDYQGAPDNGGLVLSDGDSYLSPVFDYTTIDIRFGAGLAGSLRTFSLDVASALGGLGLTFFDTAGGVIGQFTVVASPTQSAYGTPVGYQNFRVSSATGIGGFSFGSGAQGNVIVDNLAADAVPEPGTWATMILGLGLAGGALRRRRTRVRFA